MKKLNKKGFTLIELLAVIVVLAIIIVVTIPSVISSMNSAKTSQLGNAVNTVTEWFTKQYELDSLGAGVAGGPSVEYTNFLKSKDTEHTDPAQKVAVPLPTAKASAFDLDTDVLKAAGITNPDGLTGKIYVNGSKICIILTAKPETTVNGVKTPASQFYVASAGDKNTVEGSGC